MTKKHSYEMKKSKDETKNTKKNILPPIQQSMNFFVQKNRLFKRKDG
ncbi:hypothetical protein CUZ93_2010 [Enterococcus xinjiangensis]|nr:hypothetical protein [Enterococcus lactis]MBL4997976.1 hypothetical protein [Enterococcus lactis]MBL5000919.1 hypothetical protein [Enterococcus lactis]